MTNEQKQALIREHVRKARKFYMIPAHVRITLHFKEFMDEDASAYAECQPRYDRADLFFDLSDIETLFDLKFTAAHETAHVAQMYADDMFETALRVVEGERTDTLVEVFTHALELRTTHLTRMYMRHAG